ncbi:hypothetical protein KI387_043339 [Taxus chinensis]|uniref:Uncharacterized protein n=1 Tax=Taxus chinensis TaxID=29808 RepID=A0AA38F3W3_TAXCH|nr:hypothetical protein KI387_043339 [Taxus chinensis]
MKDTEMEEGEIMMEVDQTVEISTVPDDTVQRNIEDIDTGNEEEIEEEMIRKKMVELGGVLQQESVIEEPERQLEIVAFSPPGGVSKEIIVHPKAQTLSGQEFTNWLTNQSSSYSKEVIDLEEMDLQLLRTIERKRKREKTPKVTSKLVPLGEVTIEGLKQDTQTLINNLFQKLDEEKMKVAKLKEQSSKLCNIIMKVAKNPPQQMIMEERIHPQVITVVEETSDRFKAIDEWIVDITNTTTNFYKEVLIKIVEYQEKVNKLKELKQEVDNEGGIVELQQQGLEEINELSDDILIRENIAPEGSVKKGRQQKHLLSFRQNILKHIMTKIEMMEERVEQVLEELEDVIYGLTKYNTSNYPQSIEEFLPLFQQLMDKAIIPFNRKSLDKLSYIQDVVSQLGSCLGKVRGGCKVLEEELLMFETKLGAAADADSNAIKYMRDQFAIYKEKHKDEADEAEADGEKAQDKSKGKEKVEQ